MKKVLIDSSVWVSLFARDSNFGVADKTIEEIINGDYIIILPTLVYIEVINSLRRLQVGEKIINDAMKYFTRDEMVHFCHTTSFFWVNEIAGLSGIIRLRTHDLVIVAHALKYSATLISFDKKMDRAYKKISNQNSP